MTRNIFFHLSIIQKQSLCTNNTFLIGREYSYKPYINLFPTYLNKYSHVDQQSYACQETKLHTLGLCNPSPLIRRDKAHSLDRAVNAALSPNPSGPLQNKQKQTEEFSSQHVILHAAPNRRNKFSTTLQQSQLP